MLKPKKLVWNDQETTSTAEGFVEISFSSYCILRSGKHFLPFYKYDKYWDDGYTTGEEDLLIGCNQSSTLQALFYNLEDAKIVCQNHHDELCNKLLSKYFE